MISNVRTMSALFASIEDEKAERWRMIERAADEFRRSFDRTLGNVLTTFPPMTAAEADRARREAYSCSFHAHYGPRFKERYRAEVEAIGRAEVPHA